MLSQHPKAGFFYQKQPLRVPGERNVRPCEELALPQPTKFGFRSQEDEQTSCTTSRLTLVMSMRERARLGLVIRLRVKICQLLRNTTFRGHNSMIRSRPDPLRAFTGSGCGYARLGRDSLSAMLHGSRPFKIQSRPDPLRATSMT